MYLHRSCKRAVQCVHTPIYEVCRRLYAPRCGAYVCSILHTKMRCSNEQECVFKEQLPARVSREISKNIPEKERASSTENSIPYKSGVLSSDFVDSTLSLRCIPYAGGTSCEVREKDTFLVPISQLTAPCSLPMKTC